MSKSRLRHAAGLLKYKVLDCWPYKFKEIRAAKLREQLRPRAFELPRLPVPDSVEVEIHMLCGKKQLDMGIWASWSILRFMDNAILYVHSDGTLESADIDSWVKVIRGLVFVEKEEADARVESEIFTRCPLLYNWRGCYKTSPQLIDVHLFGETDRLIVMDSDVLCFRDPIELRSALCDKQSSYRWNKDGRTCYSADIGLLNQITDLSLPQAFNCGFCTTPRWSAKEFNHLEEIIKLLEVDGRVDIEHFWSGQTYYAVCAARHPNARAFSEDYSVTFGPTSDNAVVRHYVGIPAIRPRYFIEGIPRLLCDA